MTKKETGRQAERDRMLKAPIRPLIWHLTWPSMLGMFLSALCALADSFFVSRLTLEENEAVSASAAVGVCYAITAVIAVFGYLLGTGSGSLVSRFLGDGLPKRAATIARTALAAAFVCGGVLTFFGLLFQETLLRLLGASETVLPHACAYSRFLFWGAPLAIATLVLNHLLRAEGKTLWAMVALSLGSAVNVLLDWLFLFFWDWGIRGVSLAALIGQGLSFFLMLSVLLFGKQAFFRQKSRPFSLKELNGIAKAGLPSLWRQGFGMAANIALNHAAAGFGDAAVAAVSVSGRLFMLAFSVLLGLGQGYQPFVGYNKGADRLDRIVVGARLVSVVGTVGMAFLGGALYLGAPTLVRLVLSQQNEAISLGVSALRFQAMAAVLIPLNMVCNMTFQATGEVRRASFLSSCRQGLCFLPLLWLLPSFWGVTGVLLAQPLADALTFFLSLPYAHALFRNRRLLAEKGEKK